MNKKINSFFKNVRPQFVVGAVDKKQFPKQSWAEIAFIGRSNVGKSSLINAITYSQIAKTSKTPGRTREMNFFTLGDACNFVDMPGYGFAFATEKEKNNWRKLLKEYLEEGGRLARLFLLIDSRRGIMAVDFEFMGFLDEIGVDYQIILTKIDSINRDEYARIVEKVKNEGSHHKHLAEEILCSSVGKGYGLDEIRRVIYDIIKFAK
jgi:GTP-binding protein